jgi:hypothetical protein
MNLRRSRRGRAKACQDNDHRSPANPYRDRPSGPAKACRRQRSRNAKPSQTTRALLTPARGGRSWMWAMERLSILEQHADKWIPEPNTGCLIWIGATGGSDRRPKVTVDGKQQYVSRLVCEETLGPPPGPWHQAAHATPQGCIGGDCVNPNHLRWATKVENEGDVSLAERAQRRRAAHKACGGTIYDLPHNLTFDKVNQKYLLRIKGKNLGRYATIEEAVAARDNYLGVQ